MTGLSSNLTTTQSLDALRKEKDKVLKPRTKVFGGEEDRGIQGNFPEDKQTAETALLFQQPIMRKLRKNRTGLHPVGTTKEADKMPALPYRTSNIGQSLLTSAATTNPLVLA